MVTISSDFLVCKTVSKRRPSTHARNLMDGIGGRPWSVEGFKFLSWPSRTPKKTYFSVESMDFYKCDIFQSTIMRRKGKKIRRWLNQVLCPRDVDPLRSSSAFE